MTWTYSGAPATVPRDAVRFLVGDTDTDDQQVTDEEVAYALAESGGDEAAAAAICLRALAATFSRQADKAVGDLRVSASQRAKAYAERAGALEGAAASSAVPTPFAGGISVDDKRAEVEDTDRVPPAFTRGGFDMDGTDDDDPLAPERQ